jgi:hypothetical protein
VDYPTTDIIYWIEEINGYYIDNRLYRLWIL